MVAGLKAEVRGGGEGRRLESLPVWRPWEVGQGSHWREWLWARWSRPQMLSSAAGEIQWLRCEEGWGTLWLSRHKAVAQPEVS